MSAGDRGVGLLKRFKHERLFFGGNADSRIGYEEMQAHRLLVVRGKIDLHDDFTALREFDGVAEEIRKNLTQS